ncbi:MAG TPA: GWxTD domain-containing protein, partial [Acidobacteriota bacterium]|nr:GWxTD domain-containing protein [Acidobacteriota bacterium]
MGRRNRLFVIAALISLCLLPSMGQSRSGQKSAAQEEAADYYAKWLNEDVVYLISDEEHDVFQGLTTADEKDTFIEEFWRRRDPDPASAFNEYREEHYRRIAYANQHFGSGIPGWKTDRGRIYIMFGPPDESEYHSGGQNYTRAHHEGGGRTSTYPFEIWRYRQISGVGSDVEMEFVDRSWTGEFRLALYPW